MRRAVRWALDMRPSEHLAALSIAAEQLVGQFLKY
jgi:hypothetical protein